MSQLRSISRLTFINICGLVVTMLDSIVTAQWFGTSEPMRNYFTALTLLLIVQRLFMVGQFSDVFLPHYVKIRETEGGEKADRCFSALYNHIMLSLVLVAVVFSLGVAWFARLIAPGFSAEGQTAVAWFALGLLPSILLIVANGHLQIVGNARGWYGRFAFYGVLGNALGLVAMLLTARWVGVWAIVLSQVVTQVVMFLYSLRFLARNGYRHRWILHEAGFNAWTVTGRVAVTAIYVFTTQWYTIAFNAALTFLPNNLLTIYKYAESLYVKTAAIFLRPVSVVFYTDASVLAHRDPSQLRQRISHALYHYALFYAGVVAVVFPAIPNLLGALWGGPHYSAVEIRETTYYVCCLYALLIVDAAGLIYRRLNMIIGDLLPQYLAMSVVQAAMVFIAPWIVRRLEFNGAPVVLTVNVVSLLLSALVIHARRQHWHLAFFPWHTWKLVAATALPFLMVWLLPYWFPGLKYSGDNSIFGRVLEVAKAALMSGLGLALLAGAAWMLKIEEAGAAWRWAIKFLRQRFSRADVVG